jgi:hypothetical protein
MDKIDLTEPILGNSVGRAEREELVSDLSASIFSEHGNVSHRSKNTKNHASSSLYGTMLASNAAVVNSHQIGTADSSASEPHSVTASGDTAPTHAEASNRTTTQGTSLSINSEKNDRLMVDPTAGLSDEPWAGTASSAGSDSNCTVDGDTVGPGGPSGHPVKSPRSSRSKRTLGVMGLALMAYLTVSAGPYSIEEAVAAGGPGPVLLGAILWASSGASRKALSLPSSPA